MFWVFLHYDVSNICKGFWAHHVFQHIFLTKFFVTCLTAQFLCQILAFFFFLDHLIHLWVMIMKGYALQYLFMSCICGNFVQRKGLASLSVFGSIIKSHFRLESICC